MKPQDLLPCPFCGAAAGLYFGEVLCSEGCDTTDVEGWNRRSTPVPSQSRAELTIEEVLEKIDRGIKKCDIYLATRWPREEVLRSLRKRFEGKMQEAPPGASPNGNGARAELTIEDVYGTICGMRAQMDAAEYPRSMRAGSESRGAWKALDTLKTWIESKRQGAPESVISETGSGAGKVTERSKPRPESRPAPGNGVVVDPR